MNNKEDFKVLTHDQAYPVHHAEFQRINSRLKAGEEINDDYIKFKAGVEKSFEFIRERLDARQAQTDAIIILGKSVEHMADEIKEVSGSVKEMLKSTTDHEYRLADIEKNDLREELRELKEEIKSDIKDIKDKLVIIEYKPDRKLAEYFDYAFKTIVSVAVLAFLFYLTGGKLGG